MVRRVMRSVLHRWVVPLLILARLMTGELVHALPHAQSYPVNDAYVAQGIDAQHGSHCPEHEGAAAMHADSGPAEHPTEPMDMQCSLTGACDCPCLHVPAALIIASVLVTSCRAAAPPVLPLVSAHIEPAASGVFRPPA